MKCVNQAEDKQATLKKVKESVKGFNPTKAEKLLCALTFHTNRVLFTVDSDISSREFHNCESCSCGKHIKYISQSVDDNMLLGYGS